LRGDAGGRAAGELPGGREHLPLDVPGAGRPGPGAGRARPGGGIAAQRLGTARRTGAAARPGLPPVGPGRAALGGERLPAGGRPGHGGRRRRLDAAGRVDPGAAARVSPADRKSVDVPDDKGSHLMSDRYLWLVYVALAGLAWGTYVPIIFYGGNELSARPG